MKTALALLFCLGVFGFVGCKQPDPPPPPGGVSVNVPGVRVNVNNEGTSVNAPGTSVNVPR